jgi:nicotinic acid mononucleotide adenylyltransferase
MILKTEKIPFNDLVNLQLKPGINLTDHGYNFSIELLQWLEDNGQRNNYWAIGEDSIESIKNWKEFSDLNTTFVVCPIILNTHSAMQRAGEMPVHPAIKSYVIKNNLY